MLNLREKMTRAMYMSREKTVVEQEFNAMLDKINGVRQEISNKCSSIKFQRGKSKPQKVVQSEEYQPVKIALTEMKRASEVLGKEMVCTREELQLVIKHIHSK